MKNRVNIEPRGITDEVTESLYGRGSSSSSGPAYGMDRIALPKRKTFRPTSGIISAFPSTTSDLVEVCGCDLDLICFIRETDIFKAPFDEILLIRNS